MWKTFVNFLVQCCALSALMALWPNAAGAASFEARDFDALTREADQVVIGTVVAITTRRTGEREIVTDYRFDNLEVVKGSVSGNSFNLTMLGGTVGTETMKVAGAPEFKRDTRYLIFVSGNGSVMFPLVGGPQGIFQMRKDSVSGTTRVHDYSGRPVKRLNRQTGKPGKTAKDVVSDEEMEPTTDTAFVDSIRSSVAAQVAR